MHPALYKDVTVPRGFKYHYYYSPAVDGKPTLLFLHGFPATSYDWRRQVAHFQPKGYGIIAPDILGSGETSAPVDVNAFRMNEVAGDIIQILNTVKVDKVIGFGHDWGSVLLTRLAILYSERFISFVWMALGFVPPYTEPFDLEAAMKFAKALVGYEALAYWEFLISEKAPELIEKNIESFNQLLYPKESPGYWLDWIVNRGKTEEWIISNKQPGRPLWLADAEFEKINQDTVNSGIRSSLNWYKGQMANIDLEDNKKIFVENYKLKSPSFLAAATRDPVSIPDMSIGNLERFGNSVRTVKFDAGHWVHVEKFEEVNKAVEAWLETL
ncbi:Bifunctional epoxide hydrolase 2 [Psilocybe cubensis]|uniref:AB hydrolase-1 domain-containing protein n=2 Tax=Psilocybe cubensis TaxID=181762 RepID=A0A8H7Y2J9_PSICU|nr:Bifunctional epoxide hydrolase 2 [Psilocybe cubensis]KAH9481285.1 Bifunctional epoxide hydrolase 2 [Psilocybe cubensis]